MQQLVLSSNGGARRLDDLVDGLEPAQRLTRLILAMVNVRKMSAYIHLLFPLDYTAIDILLMVCGVISGVAGGIPFPLLGIVFGDLINSLNTITCSSPENAKAELAQTVQTKVLYMIYITIANFVSIYIYASSWCLVSERLARRYRRRYFESIIKQETTFVESMSPGDVLSQLVSDIETVQVGTSEKMGVTISALSYFITSYIVAFMKVPRIASLLISVVPCFCLVSLVGGSYIKKYAGRMSVNINVATSIATSCLSHLALVHTLNTNNRLERCFAAYLSQSSTDALKKATAHAVQVGLFYFVAYSANTLEFWEGGRMIAATVANGDAGVSVGAVYTVIFVLIDASFVLSQVAPFIHVFAQAASASERLLSVIYHLFVIDGTADGGSKTANFEVCNITFDNVRFAYPTRSEALVIQGMDFTIPPRKHTVIVGPSGSGKSTIFAMLERFYRPAMGSVVIDGVDVTHRLGTEFRNDIALVPQENFLFDGTAEIEEACRIAQIHDVIMGLPEQYETVCSHDGNKLSGGQRQRLSIARALVRWPRLLLLDESTSALDAESEQRIQEVLAALAACTTRVVIAHRLNTVHRADRIFLIEEGRCVEQGAHQELIQRSEEYRKSVIHQSLS